MFKCEICKRQFNDIRKFVSHLSHPKSSCKTNIQDYYNKYLRKEGEGICIYCGRETTFASLAKGYPSVKCKHCRNKGQETQLLRKQKYEEKKEKRKIERGYYNLSIVCKICNKRFKDRQGLAKHISQKHPDVNLQIYYDKYFKTPEEGICPITGNKTNFKSLVAGYYIYFGKGTNSADDKIKERKKKTLLKNYNVDNPAKANEKKRINNFKKTFQKKRELYEKRKELITLLYILTVDKKNKLQCQFCGRTFANYGSISLHITRGHKISLQDYYNTFFKQENEGICPSSNKQTRFMSLRGGYQKYKENYHNHQDIIFKIKEKSKERTKKDILKKCYKYNLHVVDVNQIKNICSLIEFKCLKCQTVYKNRMYNIQLGYGKCPQCFPRNKHISKGENELLKFIRTCYSGIILASYNELINNPSTGRKLELDVYLPDKKIAIEFNGLYWHSEQILTNPETYHIIKTEECRKKGVQLIHIFEDEWYNKKDILQKMLTHKLLESCKPKIYARQCYVKIITPKNKNDFLNLNHIQGGDASKIKLGLFIKETDYMVAVMTFSGRNLSRGTIKLKDTDWELSRFATDMEYRVVGAAGKLLKYFQRKYEWTSIFSYADLRYSIGNLYYTLGFQKISQTKPGYWYVNNQGKRFHRFGLRKRPDEAKDIPEWMLRHEQGFYRIWDCGHLKFEMLNDEPY